MKNLLIYIITVTSMLLSGCSDWLEVLPKNEQVTPNFWKSKEDVEAVLGSGYLYLRNATPILVDWGELRGASIYAYSNNKKQKFQNFQITSNDALCSWSSMYKIINMANSVLSYAPGVQNKDDTYLKVSMNSHLTEAYYLRGLCYFYLVRNFRNVPLVLNPYIDDSAPFDVAQSSEKIILQQIKNDILAALNTGAAKEFFENDSWTGATKGRATKWALYALMADVALWDEDYDTCIEYSDFLLSSTSSRRPAFMTSSDQWFEIYYPGNSNESIFEVNWASTGFGQTENSPSNIFTISTSATYQFTEAMCERLKDESKLLTSTGSPSVRTEWGAYTDMNSSDMTQYCIWKYQGIGFQDQLNVRSNKDANWIIYRMADIMLLKAEALIRNGSIGYDDAIDIINKIRLRSGLMALDLTGEGSDELTLLKLVLNERDIELAAEGKRWYDLLRFAKANNYKYKDEFIQIMLDNNQTANKTWLRSVLKNTDAWFLPVLQSELESNPLLVQNPYYGGVTNK